MTKNKLTIKERDEETRIILLNGEVVAYLTHDTLGWEGMRVAQELAVERLAPEDRAKVYAEIVSLVKSGMGKFMFRHPKDRINLMLADKFEVVFEPKKNAAGFKIVTIIVPGAERAARVKASR